MGQRAIREGKEGLFGELGQFSLGGKEEKVFIMQIALTLLSMGYGESTSYSWLDQKIPHW